MPYFLVDVDIDSEDGGADAGFLNLLEPLWLVMAFKCSVFRSV